VLSFIAIPRFGLKDKKQRVGSSVIRDWRDFVVLSACSLTVIFSFACHGKKVNAQRLIAERILVLLPVILIILNHSVHGDQGLKIALA
jgi:hypothetical protein